MCDRVQHQPALSDVVVLRHAGQGKLRLNLKKRLPCKGSAEISEYTGTE